jgi:hypothetical protein
MQSEKDAVVAIDCHLEAEMLDARLSEVEDLIKCQSMDVIECCTCQIYSRPVKRGTLFVFEAGRHMGGNSHRGVVEM